ncbi:retrovirus-related Pol polyprotein from transposon 412 [Trichonephila clavipes]|nr:retrovirus-related Pol polyprotein from transposon 412 [Trichonephila clavipes]
MVERFNRTILNNLSLMVSKNQQDWDQKVPLFLLAYRSAVHETTGYSPSQMLFGRDLRLPCDLLFGRPPDTPSSPEDIFIDFVRDFLELFYNLWRTVLAKNKIVLDPALRLQSFRTPKTQQLVSEVGFEPTPTEVDCENRSETSGTCQNNREIERSSKIRKV